MRFPPFIILFPFVFELSRVSVLKYIHSITLAYEGKGNLGKDSREEMSQKKEIREDGWTPGMPHFSHLNLYLEIW